MKHDVKTDCGVVSKLNENEWFFSNDQIGLTEFIRFQSGNYNARAPHDWPNESVVTCGAGGFQVNLYTRM